MESSSFLSFPRIDGEDECLKSQTHIESSQSMRQIDASGWVGLAL